MSKLACGAASCDSDLDSVREARQPAIVSQQPLRMDWAYMYKFLVVNARLSISWNMTMNTFDRSIKFCAIHNAAMIGCCSNDCLFAKESTLESF